MSPSASSFHDTKAWEPAKPEMLTVLERYRVLGTIGKGGMGIVFKAFHLSLERHVAIKTLRVDKISTPELVNRFRQEIKLVGQMDHANVVRATDAGEKNGVFYLVMEFLSGRDLDKLVARHGPLGRADACELVRQAALGLEYIHQKLVHRDIKPSNLMLTSAGQVKILDLGLAHCDVDEADDHEQTPAGYAIGTRAYMAPEQAQGSRAIDRRTDIYSLGCTLFKLLSGKTPYSGKEYNNTAKQLYAHCHVPLTSAPAFELVPEDLRPILLRMVAKDPDERYQSGREVAEALAPFVAGSEPARLLSASGEADEVKPLTPPLPEELSRLTESVGDTPRDAPTMSTASPAPPRTGTRRKLATGLARFIALAGLGLALWFVVAAIRRNDPPVPNADNATSPRSLDTVKRDAPIQLLDRKPLPVGWALDNPRWQLWSPEENLLQITGGPSRLLVAGTTTLPSYDFEVDIKQAPWTGEVGIFWGLREDEALKQQKIPRQEFAWFHFLRIEHQAGINGQPVRFVHRGKGTLSYNWQQEVAVNTTSLFVQNIQRLTGQVHLKIEVNGNRLANAELARESLTELCSDAANTMYQAEPYRGGVGLLALSHTATFSDVRFVSRSNP